MQILAHRLPGKKPVVLAPLGDIQYAGRPDEIALDRLKEHIAHALDLGALFIGMGDMTDFLSPSNRSRLINAGLYNTAQRVITDKALEIVDELYEEVLKPTRGKWLGMLEGHHYAYTLAGETTDHYLCRKLKAPFLGTSAMIGLIFDTYCGPRVVTLWLHHGWGSGMAVTAALQKLEQQAAEWEGVDVFLMGHHTKYGAAPKPRIYPVWASKAGPAIRDRTYRLVATGGWLKSYIKDEKFGAWPRGNYVEQRGLKPVALGAPLVHINPSKFQFLNGRYQKARREGQPWSRHWAPEIRVEV